MNRTTFRTDTLLLLTAAIWGFAFVAQRAGMDYIGPFLYNGIRFFLGSLSLAPVLLYRRRKLKLGAGPAPDWSTPRPSPGTKAVWLYGIGGMMIAGVILFTASSFQQLGIVTTTAGKAGFLTGLYVVLVPLTGGLVGRQSDLGRWIGAILAAVGLYLLSVTVHFTIAPGDVLLLLCAVFYTAHVLLIDRISRFIDPILLSLVQSAATCVLSMAAAFLFEPIHIRAIASAWGSLVYGGVMSVGIAYSMQIIAQRTAHPAHAAIILSLEGTFAAVGGFIILGEAMSVRAITGCVIMVSGMVIAQLSALRKSEHIRSS